MTERKALLLLGSPRAAKSTSKALGQYLLGKLEERGVKTKTVHIYAALKSEERWKELSSAVEWADLLVLACPLYVDSAPAPVIRAMERIAAERRAARAENAQQLVAIVNCGFPEVQHNDTAVALYRRFALEAGFEWAGGLSLGGGGVIGGRPLGDLGGMVRNVTKSLDLAAAALAEGRPLPREAQEAMSRPLIPAWAYRLVGDLGWRIQARRNRVAQKRLGDRPFAEAPLR